MAHLTIVTHHKAGEHAAWAVFGSLCCPRALQTPESLIGRELGLCLPSCRRQGIEIRFNGLGTSAVRNHTYLHFVRHPVNMIVSGYLYHRRCPEEWTRDAALFHGASDSKELVRQKGLFFGADRARHAVSNLLADGDPAANSSSYCALLQARNESTGIRAEALRSMSSGDGVRRMLLDRMRLQQSPLLARDGSVRMMMARTLGGRLRHNRPARLLGRLIEVCLSDVTPPTSERARETWAVLERRLHLNSSAFEPRLMGRSYEKHRSQGSRCSKLRLARLAREALREQKHADWLAHLHGYRDAATLDRAAEGAWEVALGGSCREEMSVDGGQGTHCVA